jgi:predicted phosphoadenosine phosphosulfate sulfurtransferase
VTLHGIAMGDQPFEYIVPSESDAGKVWRVYTHIEPWKCTCPGHLKHHHCKHIQMVQEYLAEMEGGREPEEEEDNARLLGNSNGIFVPAPRERPHWQRLALAITRRDTRPRRLALEQWRQGVFRAISV